MMQVTEAQAWFHAQLRAGLTSLYNPAVLRKSPLVKVLEVEEKRNPALALQAILLEGIEALRPAIGVPAQSEVWRQYQVLRRRYTEQAPQAQVADDLGLSTRQLQRTESLARAELANHLWQAYSIAARLPDLAALLEAAAPEERCAPAVSDAGSSSPAQELEYLSRSLAVQEISVGQAIAEVLATIRPLAEAAGAELRSSAPEHLPLLLVQGPLLHQALVNLACCAIEAAPRGAITIGATAAGPELTIRIQVTRGMEGAGVENKAKVEQSTPVAPQQAGELVETAAQLVALCGGRLITLPGDPEEGRAAGDFCAEVVLPALETTLVLVVDDNLDTQQLYSRLLAGSRYRMASALNGSTGLAIALGTQPQVILLDVMMPDKDGWTLLGQLREHPVTHNVPVIICSILPQEQLALALGAAEFLRKPLSRAALLEALQRQLARRDRASAS
jgi:CheY-like chemotaxis protein